ncbi:Protein RGF1 INDUCIBLE TRANSCRIPTION FACTOR 1 [Linum perenne]
MESGRFPVTGELAPVWLDSLLTTKFFSSCPHHKDGARTECNMFCLDCRGAAGAFCFYCRNANHGDHSVIQIRKSSYHNVVRVSEVEHMLDMGGVQTYVINSAKVVFLNERPQIKSGGAGGSGSGGGSTKASGSCEICGRSLLDSCRFCSLGCKLVRILTNGDASFKVGQIVEDGAAEEQLAAAVAAAAESEKGKEHDDESPPPSPSLANPTQPPPPPRRPSPSFRRRPRKGIPMRAPF